MAQIESAAFAVNTSDASHPHLFSELTSETTAIAFRNEWRAPAAYESARTLSFAGGGVAIGDYDSDGLSDVYLSRPFGGGKLYRNLGDFRFEDVTASVGIASKRQFWEAGCSWADIDNDGDLDLSVSAFHSANRLFLNTDGKFRDVAAEVGVAHVGASVIMAFSDYDCDGDLDAYLLTNRAYSPKNAYDVSSGEVANRVFPQLLKDKTGAPIGMPGHLKEVFDLRWNSVSEMNMFVRAGQYDRLFRNDGITISGGLPKFTDVTEEAGVKDNGMGLSATWWDYDDDGFPDLYVANDYFGADRLYHNEGNGRFKDVSNAALPHTPWYSMGANVADINNDGLLDFIGTDMSGTDHFRRKIGMGDMSKNAWFLDSAQPRQYMRNAVYVNSGTERFMEAAHLTGLVNSDWTWAVKFGDLDNDGHTDVFFANGMTGDLFNSDTLNQQRNDPTLVSVRPEIKRDANLAFRNLGDLTFDNVSVGWGLDKKAVCFGAALGDLDNDGDQDLIVNQFEGEALVYRSNASIKGDSNSIRVRLKGTKSNRWGIDAKVRIETSAGMQTRLLTLSRGFYSSDDPVLHFGLGKIKKVDRLTIDWPSGVVQQLSKLTAGSLYTITEAETSNAEPYRVRRTGGKKPLYVISKKLVSITHVEQPFDNYERQPLLPAKHSQLGPGHAWGDVDNDGDDDLFVGGSKGVAGRLHFREGKRFEVKSLAPFESDAECEDMAPLFFDADGDGDLDLYVVSGGVECQPDDGILQDRLYFNDGKGLFVKKPEALPKARHSGSVACAADFDHDGDIDLFVGGRVVPGRYPEMPLSQLLTNDGKGTFADATPASLGITGMVTSALWSDADNDGWVDLLVTQEWGSIKIWHNNEGTLSDTTSASGINDLTGWWNSIAGTDIDGDGDIDYVVGNYGLNTKYHATADHPALLYYGDFENTGRPHIVEAEFENSICYPVRGRSCSSGAMPMLAERFPTFKSFAAAPLREIYDSKRLAQAKPLQANTLESGILVNVTEKGNAPAFEWKPLPRIAQIAPVFGVVFTEINGDGQRDLVLAQNFYGAQRETGHMDGGVGLVLLGDGDGGFAPVWPDKSGISVPGDATSLSTVDLNKDGQPDLFFGVNAATQMVYAHGGSTVGRTLSLSLSVTTPPGTRITVMMDGSKVPDQTVEIHTGGGYLSQSAHQIFFGLGARGTESVKEIAVQLPNQKEERYQLSQLRMTGPAYHIETAP